MSSTNNFAKAFLFANLLLILIIPFLKIPIISLLFLILIYNIFVYAFLDPKNGLYLIILLRPCLDIFTNEAIFSLFGFSINLPSVIGFLSIVFASFLLFKNRHKKVPISIPWLIFLIIGLVSIFFSPDLNLSFKELIRLVSIFFIYLASFYTIKKNEDFVSLVKISISSAIIPSIIATYQYITKTGLDIPLENVYNRIYGTFAHPNLFSYYLLIPITLSILIFFIGKREKVTNAVIFALSLFFVIILGLTLTRGAWLAFVLIVLIIGALRYRLLLAGAVVIFFLSYLFIPSIHVRVDDLNTKRKGNSIEWRQQLWKDSLGYIKEKPVAGFGVGTANKIILERRGEQMGSPDPHNDYLKITLENGLLGLLSYISLACTALFYLVKNYFKTEKTKLKIIYLVIFALLSSLLIMSFADNVLRNTALQWTLWSLIGGLMGITYHKNIEKEII